jgi:hypothetical protein
MRSHGQGRGLGSKGTRDRAWEGNNRGGFARRPCGEGENDRMIERLVDQLSNTGARPPKVAPNSGKTHFSRV